MTIRIMFLGPLSDVAGRPEMTAEGPLDWDGLLRQVPSAVAEWLRQDRVKIACAGKVLADKTMLAARDGDEIALLPPVSGG